MRVTRLSSFSDRYAEQPVATRNLLRRPSLLLGLLLWACSEASPTPATTDEL